MISYVYKITNNVDHKVYVGKSRSPKHRWYKHTNDAERNIGGSYLHNAMRVHGIDRFAMETVSEHPDDESALAEERRIILELRANDPSVGYNLTTGGEGMAGYRHKASARAAIAAYHTGRKHTEASKAKISARKMGSTHTAEARAKIGAAVSARVVTPETRAKLSEALAGRTYKASEAQRAHISRVHKGRKQSATQIANRVASRLANAKPLSAESRVRLGDAHRGTKHSAEHKARISAALKGRKYTPEQREKYRLAAQRREAKNRCVRWFCEVMAGVVSHA